jgi:hypothetical protein
VGYSVETEKILCSGGKIIRVRTVEHYPPDTTACIFWLKNRQPEIWRDKVEGQHLHTFNFTGVMPSEEEWLEKYGVDTRPLVISHSE